MKRWRLKNMRLDRVDLVTAGANPGAHVLIHKFEAPDILEETVSNDVESVEAPEAPVEEVSMSDEPTTDPVDTVAKADFEALQKSLEDARAEISKMQQERKQAEFVAKAAELDRIGKADEVGALLLEASNGMSAEAFAALERTLKAANEQLAKGSLFVQFARSDAEATDVADRITELAKAKVAAGEAKTIELAKAAVLRENPELQSEYVANRAR